MLSAVEGEGPEPWHGGIDAERANTMSSMLFPFVPDVDEIVFTVDVEKADCLHPFAQLPEPIIMCTDSASS